MEAEAEREGKMKQEKAEKNEKDKWPNHFLNHQFSNSGQEAPHIAVIHIWYHWPGDVCQKRDALYLFNPNDMCYFKPKRNEIK